MMNRPTPESILKDVFGYDQFNPLQREVIQHLLQKRDALVIMPTGGGKSLCYQIPALLFPGLTVVVSPLIALMKDQVEQLNAVGVRALFLNSSLSAEEYQKNMGLVRSGRVKLLYVAPETLLTPRLFSLLSSVQLDCLTIDEAHCISEWGHDFRPEYRQLAEVRRRFPKAACLALTATATPRVRQDIQSTLGISPSNEFIASFDRENLMIEVQPKEVPLEQTLRFLKQYPRQSGIIYCFSRKQVDELAEQLAERGFSVRPYHAGLEDDERRRNQELFIRDEVQIITATIAFGMGINKPNVRFVIHYDLPKSIEGYYQEIGRAGRDGLPAHCLLLYSGGDVRKQNYFIEQKEEPQRSVARQHLAAMVRYAETGGCRRAQLLAYFGEKYPEANCKNCDNCRRNGSGRKPASSPQEITSAASKFLSAVLYTGERFGAAHVIQVLMGVSGEKVRRYNHQHLRVFGAGKELNQREWFSVSDHLVSSGLLEKEETYGVLRLTSRGTAALKARPLKPPEAVHPAAEPPSRPVPAPTPPAPVSTDYNLELYDLLRAERKKLADAAGVAPYVIFPDRTLVELATYLPRSTDSLLNISGMGLVKVRRYGKQVLALVENFCREHSLEERRKPAPRSAAGGKQSAPKTPRYLLVAEAYNAGRSLSELAEQYSVQIPTILDHLTEYVMGGGSLRLQDDLRGLCRVSPARQQDALAAFQELGADYLAPVFERLNGTVNYNELKILRLYYLNSR